MNVPVLPHFLPCYFCTQIVRVHPIWLCWCCRIFSGLFLRPNSERAPNVNVPVLPHFLPGHFCAQIVSAPHIYELVLSLVISAPKFSKCAQCECASVAAFFTWPFLCSNCQSVPHIYESVLPHFLAGHFCTQILRVRPMWMRWCCRICYLAISALKLSQCAQYECPGVATFSSGLFLCPNFQSGPNVNLLVLPHLLVGYFCS